MFQIFVPKSKQTTDNEISLKPQKGNGKIKKLVVNKKKK